MSRRKTEAWLVVDEGGNEFLYPYKQDSDDKIHDLQADGETGLVIPLMRRDPKAEAVVRAAVQVKAAWNSSTAEWSRAVDVLGEAVDALQASRKAKR